ncbi:hypothetical protein [Rhodococcus sp. HNM0569]|uniref:hypothetical protein n=1 Tax=Rhodococcus sp. HNM0569 TaxID=2716340 RepID=UPI00146E212B|nr:hypothetical protein [Rhodococcus sp. HNM0569]NLU83042.1 hypothetical protein [Rhodococcus sp. HNM0569]
MARSPVPPGRHRLGLPGSIPCRNFPFVARVLSDRSPWFVRLFTSGRHSLASSRTTAATPAATPVWTPATAA